jgi:hypothetical protein
MILRLSLNLQVDKQLHSMRGTQENVVLDRQLHTTTSTTLGNANGRPFTLPPL